MYNKVLVPLDGSNLAEVALTHVEEIARGCQVGEIHIISVTEAMRGRVTQAEALEQVTPDENNYPPLQKVDIQPGTIGGPIYPSETYREFSQPLTLGRMARTAEEYLEKVAQDLEEKGFKTHFQVLAGRPAEEIIKYAESEKIDLIVIGSRGHSGFGRWDMGNIAEKVIRAAKAPVLLVKPEPGFKENKPRRHGDSSII